MGGINMSAFKCNINQRANKLINVRTNVETILKTSSKLKVFIDLKFF